MERLFKEVTTLVSDLKVHLSNWGLNPHVYTDAAKVVAGELLAYRSSGRG